MRRQAARDLAIRRASERDLDVVTALRLALLHEHRSNPVYGRLRPDVATRARRLYLGQLRSPNEVTLLAERGNETLGILRCIHSAGHPLLLPPTYGYVSSVYVRPAARRRGVLRALVGAAIEWCRERDLTELRLHNAADNPLSNAAWEALGFAVVEHLRMRPLAAED